ncbi:hypothetical protein NL676_033186 [Syzygium grande]|nr:hypothetical protein NL676_033186 [Syzygium grande]
MLEISVWDDLFDMSVHNPSDNSLDPLWYSLKRATQRRRPHPGDIQISVLIGDVDRCSRPPHYSEFAATDGASGEG